MRRILTSHHPVRHIKSFKYAFSGLTHVLVNEANFRVQLIIVSMAVFFGLHYNISNTEWAILILCLGMLLSAEVINTVIEEFTDHLIKEETPAAKVIKDLSAGFVLVTALTTLVIMFLIFGDRINLVSV